MWFKNGYVSTPLTREEFKQRMKNIAETVTVIRGDDEPIQDNGVSLILMKPNNEVTVDRYTISIKYI